MTDLLPFIIATFALLAAPGPTNVLLAAAGARQSLSSASRLAAAALAGYLVAITVWTELVGAAAAAQPLVPVIAKFVAVAFLLWSAWRLWLNAGHADLDRRGITSGRVLATTLLNPKALIFAFAIFPQVGFVARLPYLGLFVGMVVATAIGWMILGTVAARSSAGLFTGPRVERITAVALAVFATLLAVQTVPGMVVG